MREPWTELYVHLVWATWDREPLVTQEIEQAVYACLMAEAKGLRCEPIAVGGVEDHVHLLVRLHPTVSVSELVKQVKGSSSHLVTHRLAGDHAFRWQGTYGAFTVAKSDVPRVCRYIKNQKEHHCSGDVQPEFERMVYTDSEADRAAISTPTVE